MFIDVVGFCFFMIFGFGVDDYCDMFNVVFGWDFFIEDYFKIGERIWNVERLFNFKVGLDFVKDEILFKRFFEELMFEGLNKGYVVRFKEMLLCYYKLCGWIEDGRILREKVEEFGIVEFF